MDDCGLNTMKLQINGASIHVLQSAIGAPFGSNPQSAMALVFLHYFGGASRSWKPVIECLEDDFRCVAPDLRGFGDSDGAQKDLSVGDAADDVQALIKKLQLKNYALVGHSMGGKIALEVAARQPRGLHSLVLLAPSPPSPEPMPDSERTRLMSTHGTRKAALETLQTITAQPLPSRLFEQAVEDNLRSSKGAWQAWLECGSREDISSRMNRIKVPVLVVASACDEGITSKLLQREVVARIEKSRFCEMPAAAHLLPLEAPSAVAVLIEKWMASGASDWRC